MQLEYVSGKGEATARTVRPLGLFFWGNSWSLTGWCEMRDDFRSFRLDRMREMRPLRDRFHDEPGHTLDDYLARMGDDRDW